MGLADAHDNLFLGGSPRSKIDRLDQWGQSNFNSGSSYTDEAINNYRGLASQFQSQINDGGLTSAMRRQFDVGRGDLSDQATRAGRGFQEQLSQMSAQNGGELSPAAMAQLAKEHGIRSDEQLFGATNQLNMGEATMAQAATQSLQQRLLDIQDSIRTTGLTREQMGIMAELQAAQLQHQRNKDIDASQRSWVQMFMGGFK